MNTAPFYSGDKVIVTHKGSDKGRIFSVIDCEYSEAHKIWYVSVNAKNETIELLPRTAFKKYTKLDEVLG